MSSTLKEASVKYPLFLSVVLVVRNLSEEIENFLRDATSLLEPLVSDYELIIVDNASDDNSMSVLQNLTGQDGLPNLQVYGLIKHVNNDIASWAGIENALGDYVIVANPLTDDINFISEMLERATTTDADVVFAKNNIIPQQNLTYKIANSIFQQSYKMLHGVHLSNEAPKYRLISRKIINFILQNPQPAIAYRHLPATGGFSRQNMEYSANPQLTHTYSLMENIDKGMRLLTSSTRVPMRLVTTLSLFGALTSLLYSFYVILVALFKTNVMPGWTSLSLQMSGMFFLISLVLLILGEYILNMASLSSEGPLFHINKEFTSARLTRREKLNIEQDMSAPSINNSYDKPSEK